MSCLAAAPPHANGYGPNKIGTVHQFVAPFDYAGSRPDPDRSAEFNAKSCDDGQGTLVCTVAVASDTAGSLSASARLHPADDLAAADAGMAWAIGWAGQSLRLPGGLTQVDVTATLVVDEATASSTARSTAAVDGGVHVTLSACSECGTQSQYARSLHAYAGLSSSDRDRPMTVTISITPPDGYDTIPKGRMWISGSLGAIVRSEPLLNGTPSATVEGRLTSLRVTYVA